MIAYVVAYSKNRVIGKEGKLPWHLPNDLKHFKNITEGKTVVMGKKTYLSIGKPLTNRKNVVMTRSRDFHSEGVDVAHSKEEVLSYKEDLYIIGGEQIYSLFFDVVDRLYITEIDIVVEGDTFFPDWDRSQFRLVEKKEGILDEKNPFPHTFYIYERKSN